LKTLSHHPTKILFELFQAQGCQQFEIVKEKDEDQQLTRCDGKAIFVRIKRHGSKSNLQSSSMMLCSRVQLIQLLHLQLGEHQNLPLMRWKAMLSS
jgi:hypothetical protein